MSSDLKVNLYLANSCSFRMQGILTLVSALFQDISIEENLALFCLINFFFKNLPSLYEGATLCCCASIVSLHGGTKTMSRASIHCTRYIYYKKVFDAVKIANKEILVFIVSHILAIYKLS